MRFRGKIVDVVYIRKFDSIITAVSKIAKTCIMRLTSDKICLIMTEGSSVVGGPAVWGEIDQEAFFNEYNMEGVTSDHNEIHIEFSTDSMHKNLTTLKNSNVRGLKMKLTKKNSVPNLTFEVTLNSSTSSRQVIHDIPVQIVPRSCWQGYTVPELPPVDISLCIPFQEVKRLKTVVEKFRGLGSVLKLTSRRDGTLTLKVESDEVSVAGHFKELREPNFRANQVPWTLSEENMDIATVQVDIKRLHTFLLAEMLQPERVVLNIVDEEILHILLVTSELVLQFYLPRSGRN